MLGAIKTSRLVTFIDACYSASTAELGTSKSLTDLEKIYPDFQGDGRVALTASKGDQLSVIITDESDPGFGHSAFAYHVIEGLKGKADGDGNQDGVVEVDELWNYVKNRTILTARRQGGNQEPQLKGQLGSRFLLAVDSERLLANAKRLAAGAAEVKVMVAKLKELFLDEAITPEQYREGRRVLESMPEDLDKQDLERRDIYADLADGDLQAKYLNQALAAVETPEQRRIARNAEL